MNVEFVLRKSARYNGDNGTAWDDPSNLERLNDVRQLIYELGDYEGTMEWVLMDLHRHSFALPETCETVRAAAECRHPIEVRAKNYQFISHEFARTMANHPFYGYRQMTLHELDNKHPYECPISKSRFGVVCCDPRDIGKQVTLECKRNGRCQSYTLTLKGRMKMDKTPVAVDDILNVTKDLTFGDVQLIECPTGAEEKIVATWANWNTSPMFSWYKPHRHNDAFFGIGRSPRLTERQCCEGGVLFCKRRFFDLMDLRQQVDIKSLSAIKFGYQALNKQEAENNKSYAEDLLLMQKQLSFADSNLMPGDVALDLNVEYQTTKGSYFDGPRFDYRYGLPPQ